MSQRFSKSWAGWVYAKRCELGLTCKELAEAVEIHSSYITLFERDGLIPSLDVAERLGSVFRDTDKTLIRAGYVPQEWIGPLLDLIANCDRLRARAG